MRGVAPAANMLDESLVQVLVFKWVIQGLGILIESDLPLIHLGIIADHPPISWTHRPKNWWLGPCKVRGNMEGLNTGEANPRAESRGGRRIFVCRGDKFPGALRSKTRWI